MGRDYQRKKNKQLYYVGSSTVVESDWLTGTLQESIDKASSLVEEDGSTRYVVKVVAIVKAKEVKPNVIVEMIK